MDASGYGSANGTIIEKGCHLAQLGVIAKLKADQDPPAAALDGIL
jgi:hypothetical protein